MKTQLIRVGNSRGIRIPKPIIEQCGFEQDVELRVEGNCVVISAPRRARQGWRDAFRASGVSAKDDLLLDVPNDFDHEEWTW